MKTFVLGCLLCFSLSAFSQDYMDKIAEKTCDCLRNLSADVNAETALQKLSVCIIVEVRTLQSGIGTRSPNPIR